MGAVTPADVQKAAQTYLPKNQEHGKYVLMLRDPLKK
jgi:predicted Zn-dependent peptidase